MATRPRIGVTGNARRWSPSWWCTALALQLAGATPVRISVSHPPDDLPLDGLIIGGGDDISAEHYDGDLNAQVKIDPARDELEIAWIQQALQRNLPLLGICRGAQLINVVLGGNLHQDIRAMRRLTYNRPGLLPTKQVRLRADSILAGICGKARLRVNSLHHQAIKQTGAELDVVGWDLDQITQAVEWSGGRIIGVQWHPEYLFYLPAQFALFRWLVRGALLRQHPPSTRPMSAIHQDPLMSKPLIAEITPIKVTLVPGEEYYFCRCGRSQNQPFCDGSHAGTEFTPLAFTAEAEQAVLCRCKQTGNPPFCDGSHKQLVSS